MANLLLKRLDEVPASLNYRSIIIVGTGDELSLYIGNASNVPTEISFGSVSNINDFLLGNTQFDENLDMGFDLDETVMKIIIAENN